MWNRGTFKSGTFMWNLVEPGSRFRAAAPNHPEALLEEPQAFQAVEEKKKENALLYSSILTGLPRLSLPVSSVESTGRFETRTAFSGPNIWKQLLVSPYFSLADSCILHSRGHQIHAWAVSVSPHTTWNFCTVQASMQRCLPTLQHDLGNLENASGRLKPLVCLFSCCFPFGVLSIESFCRFLTGL